MFISAKTFMELMERIIRAEKKAEAAEAKAAELEKKVERLDGRPVLNVKSEENEEKMDASRVVQELLYGIPDEKTGKVIYTDGR